MALAGACPLILGNFWANAKILAKKQLVGILSGHLVGKHVSGSQKLVGNLVGDSVGKPSGQLRGQISGQLSGQLSGQAT